MNEVTGKLGRFACCLLLVVTTLSRAQPVEEPALQEALLAALPEGVDAASASPEDITRAAIDVVFALEGELEPRVTRVTIALGQLEEAGVFASAPQMGPDSPTLHFYNSMINLSSASGRGMTPQYIIRVSGAMIEGINILNGALP